MRAASPRPATHQPVRHEAATQQLPSTDEDANHQPPHQHHLPSNNQDAAHIFPDQHEEAAVFTAPTTASPNASLQHIVRGNARYQEALEGGGGTAHGMLQSQSNAGELLHENLWTQEEGVGAYPTPPRQTHHPLISPTSGLNPRSWSTVPHSQPSTGPIRSDSHPPVCLTHEQETEIWQRAVTEAAVRTHSGGVSPDAAQPSLWLTQNHGSIQDQASGHKMNHGASSAWLHQPQVCGQPSLPVLDRGNSPAWLQQQQLGRFRASAPAFAQACDVTTKLEHAPLPHALWQPQSTNMQSARNGMQRPCHWADPSAQPWVHSRQTPSPAPVSGPSGPVSHPLYPHLDLSRPLCLQQPSAFAYSGGGVPALGPCHESPSLSGSFQQVQQLQANAACSPALPGSRPCLGPSASSALSEAFQLQQAPFRPQQASYQPQQAPFQPQQAFCQPQQGPYQPQQASFQHQQSSCQNQQSSCQPQQASFQVEQAAFQPQQSPCQPQPTPFLPQQPPFQVEEAAFQPQQAAFCESQQVAHQQRQHQASCWPDQAAWPRMCDHDRQQQAPAEAQVIGGARATRHPTTGRDKTTCVAG